MAHQSNITVGGHIVPVWEFDSTAQQIDDAVAVLGAAGTPQAALAALGAAVQENELDNAYFVGGGTGYGVFPVNQRGVIQSSGESAMFDRWKLYVNTGGSVSLTENGLSIVGGNPYTVITQTLKRALPVGATYSMSILQHDGSFYSGEVTIPAKNAYSQSIPIFSNGSQFRLYGPNSFELVVMSGDTLAETEIIKLEPGGTQTAAYKNTDGKWAMLPQNLDYRQELTKCQAYQIELNSQRAAVPTFGTAMKGPTFWYAVIPLPVAMRATPVVTLKNGPFYVECAEGSFPVSSLTPLSFTTNLGLYVVNFENNVPVSAVIGTFFASNSENPPSMLLDANL